jgi:hypothetical protein
LQFVRKILTVTDMEKGNAMTKKQAKQLKRGNRVVIRGNWGECYGTVTHTGWDAITFTWDDGCGGVIHINDLDDVFVVAD